MTWHADLNNVNLPWRSLLFPEVSAYLGLGRGWNLGTGGYPIIPPSHLSIAKYFAESEDNFTSLYFHGAGSFITSNNPRYEVGVLFSNLKPDQSRQFGLGLSILQRQAWHLHFRDPVWKFGPFPVLKYQYRHEHFGLSWGHYIGRTRSMVIAAISGLTDTVVSLPATAIDSIAPWHGKHHRYECEGFAIYMSDGKVKHFRHSCRYPDLFYDFRRDFECWTNGDTKIYSFDVARAGGAEYAIICYPELLASFERGERVIIQRVSPLVHERIRRINSLKDDNTLGISVFADPR